MGPARSQSTQISRVVDESPGTASMSKFYYLACGCCIIYLSPLFLDYPGIFTPTILIYCLNAYNSAITVVVREVPLKKTHILPERLQFWDWARYIMDFSMFRLP